MLFKARIKSNKSAIQSMHVGGKLFVVCVNDCVSKKESMWGGTD